MQPISHLQSSWRTSVTLGALLTLSLTACGGTPAPAPGTPNPSTVRISGNVTLPQGSLALGAQSVKTTGEQAQNPVGQGGADWSAPHVPGELLVSSGGLSAQAVNTRLGGLHQEHLSQLNMIRVQTSDPQELAQQLAAEGVSSQPNYLYTALAIPNDPGFPGRAGVQIGEGQQHQTYLTQIGAAEGWAQLGAAPAGALTAVLDTGVDLGHPDLRGRLASGYDTCSVLADANCQGEDGNPSEVKAGQTGHGTAMTGMIAAATNNGLGLSGMTWQGQAIPIKVFGDNGQTSSATTVSLASGIAKAVDLKARVINMSLGIPKLNTDPKVHEQLLRAANADILMISSVGNTPGDGIYFPANHPTVMAVGAVNPAGQMSCFSARPQSGQTLDLLAPGGEYGCDRPTHQLLELAPGGYQLGIGTSEASALTSGAASLIRAAYPGLSAAQVRQALVTGGKPTDSAQPQLNLPGALAAAKALVGTPAPPQPVYYDLTVQAYQNGKAVGAPFQKVGQQLTSLSLPYELNVLQGTYELRAVVDTSKASYSGKTTASAPASGVNITVQ
ncbi:serine protease [Deinococcus piscis]|uniref:Serine protease n=1 Tax=Deinococcus piscis TaxID=394230 RepID=A0ABQ3K3Z7_9DEIO|nr:S8 family serine peptidase [Deinococcus piscis]GHF94227.1 serine protease [Deinococcus piscis]